MRKKIKIQLVFVTLPQVFVVGPDKLKLSMYPATTGRNFDELLSVIDSLELTALKVATPVDWRINTHSHFDIGQLEKV